MCRYLLFTHYGRSNPYYVIVSPQKTKFIDLIHFTRRYLMAKGMFVVGVFVELQTRRRAPAGTGDNLYDGSFTAATSRAQN